MLLFVLKREFNFLSSVRSTGLRTRACAFTTRGLILERAHFLTLLLLFNCLDTDLKEVACVSRIIFHLD